MIHLYGKLYLTADGNSYTVGIPSAVSDRRRASGRTAPVMREARYYDIVPQGEENAIPAAEVCRILGVTPRERRAIAARELNEGLLVLYTTEKLYKRKCPVQVAKPEHRATPQQGQAHYNKG